MKKFNVIEEGRLNDYERAKITGGGKLTCSSKGGATYSQSCGGVNDFVNCPINYCSCGEGLKISCNTSGGYIGTKGGAGYFDVRAIDLL